MTRWRLIGIEARAGETIHKNLSMIRELTAPRVQSACLSTTWNRWCTPRRFKDRDSPKNLCLLGCGGLAEDSIEHYARCRAVRRTSDLFLKLSGYFELDLIHFVLASEALHQDNTILTCISILIYSVYRSTNIIRARDEGPASEDTAREMLEQNCREAMMGHVASTRILDSRWAIGLQDQSSPVVVRPRRR